MPRATPVERDDRMLTFIAGFIDDRGYAPTYREMAAHFEVTVKTVRDTLGRLRSRGRVTWSEGKTRTLRVVAQEAAQ